MRTECWDIFDHFPTTRLVYPFMPKERGWEWGGRQMWWWGEVNVVVGGGGECMPAFKEKSPSISIHRLQKEDTQKYFSTWISVEIKQEIKLNKSVRIWNYLICKRYVTFFYDFPGIRRIPTFSRISPYLCIYRLGDQDDYNQAEALQVFQVRRYRGFGFKWEFQMLL